VFSMFFFFFASLKPKTFYEFIRFVSNRANEEREEKKKHNSISKPRLSLFSSTGHKMLWVWFFFSKCCVVTICLGTTVSRFSHQKAKTTGAQLENLQLVETAIWSDWFGLSCFCCLLFSTCSLTSESVIEPTGT
jgi:hypothetical protein